MTITARARLVLRTIMAMLAVGGFGLAGVGAVGDWPAELTPEGLR